MVKRTAPKNKLHVSACIHLLNPFQDMLTGQSHLLQHLITLTSDKITFKWTDVEHKSFEYRKHTYS